MGEAMTVYRGTIREGYIEDMGRGRVR